MYTGYMYIYSVVYTVYGSVFQNLQVDQRQILSKYDYHHDYKIFLFCIFQFCI